MIKTLILVLLITLALSRTYPMFKQCDPRWADVQLGTSSNTICNAGSLISSVSMFLAGLGFKFDPSTLNSWLKSNRGYVSGDLFDWNSIYSLYNLKFDGFVANSQIKHNLDSGNIVICNVHNGKHWVLAYGYNGDNILVNDPNYTVPSYSLS